MVDVNRTIYKNIIDRINALRYQAKDNPEVFKLILSLIILDWIIYWAEGLDESPYEIKQLIEKRNAILMHNSCLNIIYADTSSAYTNTNTPQTNDTWKRIWDASNHENYVKLTTVLTPTNPSTPEKEDSCLIWGGFKDYK